VKQDEQKTSLLADLLTPRDNATADSCKFTRTKIKMSEEEQDALERAVGLIRQDNGLGKSKTYSASWLTKVMRQHGYNVSISTIQRHVNKECCCYQGDDK
jgi:hypothetical protein